MEKSYKYCSVCEPDACTPFWVVLFNGDEIVANDEQDAYRIANEIEHREFMAEHFVFASVC